MTLIATCLVAAAALCVGAWVGYRRGPVLGVASALGVLAAGAVGYAAVFVIALPA